MTSFFGACMQARGPQQDVSLLGSVFDKAVMPQLDIVAVEPHLGSLRQWVSRWFVFCAVIATPIGGLYLSYSPSSR
jgi:hypothetical protein